MANERTGEVRIESESDIVAARRIVRTTAMAMGFGVTAASELTRNVFRYAGSGVMRWRAVKDGEVAGLELTFEDQGPGIPDLKQALEVGYTTKGGLGLGLPGAKRLMDEMEIKSEVGQGTRVTVKKWRK